jgi:two-component system, cell cycle response regulator
MALRVLLADESTTIKKVIQLSLQDFGVEVKAVPVGDDVLAVTQSFKPDIIFVDVLLSKKSGYDVGAELKNNPATQHIPLVLMWSGFMDLDEAKVKLTRPDRRLEKPFDAEILRNLVRELVPSTQSNEIAQFLKFPKMPAFEEKAAAPPVGFAANSTPSHTIDDEPDEFEMSPPPKVTDTEQWGQGGLNEFNNHFANGLNLQNANLEPLKLNEDVLNFDDAPVSILSAKGELQEIQLSDIEDSPAIGVKYSSKNAQFQIDPTHAQQLISEQARDVLQTVAWQILPDIIEKVVREEIQKLLKESERL